MTPKNLANFPTRVLEAYQDAKHNSLHPHGRIKRYTQKSLSELFEDYFAEWCDMILPSEVEGIKIYLGPNLGYSKSDEEHRKFFRPDICIVKDGKMLQMWDIKTDLGYKRDGLPKIVEKHHEEASPKTVKNVHQDINIEIPPHTPYYTLIISLKNAKPDLQAWIEDLNAKFPDAKTFFLFKEYHPNENFAERTSDKRKALEEANRNMAEIETLVRKVLNEEINN